MGHAWESFQHLENRLKIKMDLAKPYQETADETEYILITKFEMQNIQVMKIMNTRSDHVMVRCKVKIHFQRGTKKAFQIKE